MSKYEYLGVPLNTKDFNSTLAINEQTLSSKMSNAQILNHIY